MSKYVNSVKDIKEQILKKLISGEDIIIIGDNSSGKSEILMKLALELKEKRKNIYFIDSVNRSFDTSKATLSPIGKDREQKTNVGESMEYLNRVIDVRVSEQKFNLVDSFGDIYKIEELYFLFEENLKDLFLEFVGKEFQMERLPIPELGILKNVSRINGEEVMLSNGYQAIIRIFLELLFYQKVTEKNNLGRGILIMDEIDKYLSPSFTAKIIPFLQEKFPELILCVTTHARDLLMYATDYLVCPMKQRSDGTIDYEFISSRDIQSYKKVETIFSDLFFDKETKSTSSNDEIDTRLRQMLNMKLIDSWNQELEKEFVELGSKQLAPHQKLIYLQIKEW